MTGAQVAVAAYCPDWWPAATKRAEVTTKIQAQLTHDRAHQLRGDALALAG